MSDQHPAYGIRTDRVVRVFVSSTFKDMQEEREELIKRIFPQLRKLCESRGIVWGEVDLRWGIPDEAKAEGKVLPICLAEIHRCRPYFIGLLGERYGWVPEEIPPDLIAQEPWLNEHLHHSVTELEILHGVLNNPEMADRSYFYFRTPAYLNGIPTERRADFLSEDPDAKIKLANLKDRIRASGLPVRENYADPETVGRWIMEDLWAAIDAAYPVTEVPEPLEREAAEHEAFAASRAKVYIGRQEYYDRLDRHAASEDLPLVILGESGVGKSALLANWVQRYRQTHLEDLVFFHFIGATPQSTDYVGLLHRLISEIKRRTGDPEEVPVQPDKLREALPLWLAKAAAWAGKEQRKVIIILDALNQFEDRAQAPDLGWLPGYFPANIRVILSTLPGRPLMALEKRGWPTFTVARLEPAEMQQVIREYLGIYRKTLDAPLVADMVAAPQAANPLYLKALLDELRVFGIFEKRGDYLRHYLTAPDPPALYGLILRRLEQDYEKPRPGLVGEALKLIWAARRGLMESEMLELLGTRDGPLPRVFWSPLALALEDSLVSRSGLLTFFHDYLRQAVQERYLTTSAGAPDQEAEQNTHLRLADYFEKRDLDDRQADELPWQLEKAQAWTRLKDCVTELDMFLRLMTETSRYELMRYWQFLKKHYDMVEAYVNAINYYKQSINLDHLIFIALFFQLNYMNKAAEDLYRHVLSIVKNEVGLEHHIVANIFNNLASLLNTEGDYKEAESLLRQALSICQNTLGPEDPYTANCIVSLALVLIDTGKYEEAELFCRRALAIREKILGPEHSDTALSLGALAGLFEIGGKYEEAKTFHIRALTIIEKVYGPNHPLVAKTLHNLGHLLCDKGDFNEAEPLLRRALTIFEDIFGLEHPDTANALRGLGALIYRKGDYKEAESLFRQSLAVEEKVLGPENRQTAASLLSLANLLLSLDNYKEAESVCRRALAAWENVLSPEHPHIALCLSTLTNVLLDIGNYEEAEKVLRQALTIQKKTLGIEHPETASSLFSLAGVLQKQGDYEEAELHLRQVLTIREKTLGIEHPDTASTLNSLAGLLRDKGSHKEAESLCRRALAIQEKVLGSEHCITINTLHTLAVLLTEMGKYENAEHLLRRALALREKVLGHEHSETALSFNTLGGLLYYRGNHKEAEPLLRRALEIREKVLPPEHPDIAITLNNLGALLQAKGDLQGAEPFLRRALSIREKSLGLEHPDTAQSLHNLAVLLQEKRDYKGAEPLLRRALAILQKVLGQEHFHTASTLNALAVLLYYKGDHQEAESLLKRSLAIREKILGPEHPNIANGLCSLASLLQYKGEFKKAEPLLRRALGIFIKSLGPEHPQTIEVISTLVNCLLTIGDRHKAIPLMLQLSEIHNKIKGA